ncbi:hypothetical protein [Mycobacterium sp. NPDC006124]|uniref:hypothetical protein n=1 Tax=Mycobacterium sp. NPDC006124 TaxID=3156729 RepID=UPI0033BB48DA
MSEPGDADRPGWPTPGRVRAEAVIAGRRPVVETYPCVLAAASHRDPVGGMIFRADRAEMTPTCWHYL